LFTLVLLTSWMWHFNSHNCLCTFVWAEQKMSRCFALVLTSRKWPLNLFLNLRNCSVNQFISPWFSLNFLNYWTKFISFRFSLKFLNWTKKIHFELNYWTDWVHFILVHFKIKITVKFPNFWKLTNSNWILFHIIKVTNPAKMRFIHQFWEISFIIFFSTSFPLRIEWNNNNETTYL
jgi:hypothetical protein